MKEYLPNGYKINNDRLGEYTIMKVLGRGASTIAYLAQHDNQKGVVSKRVLKEYYPAYMAVSRSKDGFLIYDEKLLDKFEKGKEEFKECGQRQNELRNIQSLTNQTPPIQEIFYANNTVYLDVIPFEGETFDNIHKSTLLEQMYICLSIAKLIKRYHDAGYLCLDLKPSNILVMDTTAKSQDVINFIDFDSIRKKSEIGFGDSLSYTELWASPEQKNPYSFTKISEKTDIFAVGELVFWSVFHRHSNADEHRRFSGFPFEDVSAPFSKDLSRNSVQKKLSKLFHNTLRSSVSNRYSSMDEVISILEELINELEKKMYICDYKIHPNDFFVGREKELKEIEMALQKHDIVFVSGIGGIGKSELIKQYLRFHRDEYDLVLYWIYEGDFENMICNDSVRIAAFSRLVEENDTQYCERKLKTIRELLNEKKNNLVVIDNFEKLIEEMPIQQQEAWNLLQTLPCKILVSTRNCESVYTTISISEISEMKEMKRIFMKHCQYDVDQESYVEDVIKSVDHHTLMVELLAKQTKAKHISPQKTLEEIQAMGITRSFQEKVRLSKDGKTASDSVMAHIKKIFSTDAMTEEQIILMTKLAFMPKAGLPIQTFCAFYSIDLLDDMNWLIDHGWVSVSNDSFEIVSVHPLIAEVVIECAKMKSNILDEFYREATVAIRVRDVEKLKEEEHNYLSDSIASSTYKYHVETKEGAIFLIEYVGMFGGYGNLEVKEKLIQYAIKKYESLVPENVYSDILEEAYIDYVYILAWKRTSYDEMILICKNHIQKSKKAKDNYSSARWYMLLAHLYGDKGDGPVLHSYIGSYFYYRSCLSGCKIKPNRKDTIDIVRKKREQFTQVLAERTEYFETMRINGLFDSRDYMRKIQVFLIQIALKYRKRSILLNSNANDEEIVLDEAKIYCLIKKYDEAKKCLQRIVDHYDAHKLVPSINLLYIHFMLGQIADREKDRQTAIKEFEICQDIKDKIRFNHFYDVQIELGRLYSETEEFEKAERINVSLLEEVRKIAPEVRSSYYADALYNLGRLFYFLEMYRLALKVLRWSEEEYGKAQNVSLEVIWLGKARVYRCLAEWYISNPYVPVNNKYEPAVRALEKSTNYYKNSVGLDYPEAQEVMQKMEEIKNKI